MTTDAELYELEMLLIEKFEKFDFGAVLFDNKSGLVYINDEWLEKLVYLCFNDRHIEFEQGIVISFDIFKILQSRYFRENKTIPLIN